MIKKILIIGTISILGFIAIFIFIIYSFTNGMCKDEIIGKYISPDTKHTINYFVRDCGATTGFVNNIELDSNLIVRAEPNDGGYAPFRVRWIDDEHILIEVVASTTSMRIYKQPLSNYRGIDISLDPKIISSYNAYQRR